MKPERGDITATPVNTIEKLKKRYKLDKKEAVEQPSITIAGLPMTADITASDLVNAILPTLLDTLFPVGTVLSSSTDPSNYLGGTWTQIKDKFILAAGDDYTEGDTGGEAEHTLTTNEMPKHNHPYSTTDLSSGGSWTVHHYSSRALNGTLYTSNVGGDQPHNNMPPYIVKKMWERTA